MQSTDQTGHRAEEAGATVYSFGHTRYVEPSRNFAFEKADGEWVFILDADERITDQLAHEVQEVIATTSHTHFKVPRKNIFGRVKWLKHGGWWPDHQMRLVQKSAFRDWPTQIHSTPVISGTLGYLENPFLHYFHGNLETMVAKTALYEGIEADLLHAAGRDASVPLFFRKYLGELSRRLIRNKGFLDGKIGILESLYQAYSKTITYLLLYEKKKSRSL
jgi:glycosyltransferase involved in cell wall biosynthesis